MRTQFRDKSALFALICLMLPSPLLLAQSDSNYPAPYDRHGNGGGVRGLLPTEDLLLVESRAACPVELYDSGFEPFVHISLLGQAVSQRDASLLTDVALQLGEGERVLRRKHASGVTSQKTLELAMKVASQQGNKAALERIAKAARVTENAALANQIAAVEKMGGLSRVSDPALAISLEDLSLETTLQLKMLLDAVAQAELVGSREQLDQVEARLKDCGDLTPAQQEAVTKRIHHARESLPAESDAQLEAIAKLSGANRQHWVTRPGDWGRTGVRIFGGGQSVSEIQVSVGPSIDRDGVVWSGSGSGGGNGEQVGRATLTYDSSGQAWWSSNYSNIHGRILGQVRAFMKYDRPNPQLQLGRQEAGRPTNGPSAEAANWWRNMSPAQRAAFLRNGARPSLVRP